MKGKCDFCGEKKEVFRSGYGTAHYVRLMCKDCETRIIAYHKSAFGETMTHDDLVYKEAK